jgi:hypothetical protein
MGNPPPLTDLVRALQAAVAALGASPVADEMRRIGGVVFIAVATILIVWYGIKMMFGRRDPSGEIFGFAKLLLTIAVVYSALTYYDQPVPGLGVSATDLVPARRLADRRDHLRGLRADSARLLTSGGGSSWRIPFSLLPNLTYWALLLIIGLAQAVVLFVTAFGLIASGVCLVMGPLFIPFALVPSFEWLFWGWLKAFVQYSFMQVVAQLFIALFSSYVLAYLTQVPPGLTVEGTLLWGTLFRDGPHQLHARRADGAIAHRIPVQRTDHRLPRRRPAAVKDSVMQHEDRERFLGHSLIRARQEGQRLVLLVACAPPRHGWSRASHGGCVRSLAMDTPKASPLPDDVRMRRGPIRSSPPRAASTSSSTPAPSS